MPRTPANMTQALKKPERKQFVALTNIVMIYIKLAEALMKEPHSDDRDKRLARLINALEIENDRAQYFALGVNSRTDKKKPLKR
ncbi:hypothetical protein LG047_15655 [Methylocystis sp. WRRC1]|nr:hypothetical protein [Methylocystis sp. WRRC1]